MTGKLKSSMDMVKSPAVVVDLNRIATNTRIMAEKTIIDLNHLSFTYIHEYIIFIIINEKTLKGTLLAQIMINITSYLI